MATIKHYRSGTADSTPSAGNLDHGVLALNYNDGKIFYKNSSNTVSEFTSGGGGSLSSQTSDSSGWLQFASSSTVNSGSLFKVKNDSDEVFAVEYDGQVQLKSVSSKGTASTGKFVFDGTDLYIGV